MLGKIRKKQSVLTKGMGLLLQMMFLFLFCGCADEPQLITESLRESENVSMTKMSTEVQGTDIASLIQTEDADAWVVETKATCYVYVCGCVNQPGVYEVEEGTRIFEVIELAGGLTQNASEVAINLADEVSDGQQIYVPDQEEAVGISFAQESQESGLVNINTADSAMLQTLPGIGQQKAEQIIQYRESHGGFSSIEEIKNVSGIGDSTYERLKQSITV